MTCASLRTRWVTLTGSFVALTLGVALLATMGLALASTLDAPAPRPERLAAAAVVVRGPDELRVGAGRRPLAGYRGVPAEAVARLAAAAPTVADRSFEVRPAGSRESFTGHPWSVARYGGYRLSSGRAPAAAGEVAVSGSPALLGSTMLGRAVVGTVPPAPYERAVFFTDAEAARLSPRIDNLVVEADPAVVRALVGAVPGIQVLTGDARRRADADPDRDAEALMTVNALLGTAGGVTTFVSVFVVASTFAFAVAQRRRELGLLRAAGATPGQVRRMVLAEAAVVGVLASAAGCALGSRGAPLLARLLVEEGLAPPWFHIGAHRWPFHLAFWTGQLVALAGAATAAVRAGRVSPLEALRAAAVESRGMPPGRLIAGALMLATGLGLPLWRLLAAPAEALHRKTFTTQPMLLITAAALLAPIVVRPLVRALRLPGVTGLLAREHATAGLRRTAAVAAPVLVTVALTGSLLGATATIAGAEATELRDRTRADLIIERPDAATVARARAVPGAVVMTGAETAVSVLEDGTSLISFPALAVDPGALASVRRLPVVAGSLADLDDTSIVVTDEWAEHTVGSRLDVWLGDGTPRRLRVAAVLAAGTGSDGAYLTAANAPGLAPDRLEMTVPEPASAAGLAGTALTREQWLADQAPRTGRQTRAGLLVVLGIALLYTAIALANTLVMATADRVPEFTALRLAGATRGQVLRLTVLETLLAVAVGALVGAVVTLLNLAGIWAALGVLTVWSPVVVPWPPLACTVVACALVAVTAALATAVRRTR